MTNLRIRVARALLLLAEQIAPLQAPPGEVLSPWDDARFDWVPRVGWRRSPLGDGQ